jgi:hypothetical protein
LPLLQYQIWCNVFTDLKLSRDTQSATKVRG